MTNTPELLGQKERWLVTGVAGFIGSHLLEHLLNHDQEVRGIDDFSTGFQHNLDLVKAKVGPEKWSRFKFVKDSIENIEPLKQLCAESDIVLHQAALGSVPRSLETPLRTHEVNVSGFLNLLEAARASGVKRIVYASSSSVYGDSADLPKREDRIGKPLSPYALSKLLNEQYADVWQRAYGLPLVGLRYFNVFGPRQSPDGPYAAVIPRWIARMKQNQVCEIYGDGQQSRDFCYIDNVVKANISAALTPIKKDTPISVFNIACGEKLSLVELHKILSEEIAKRTNSKSLAPKHLEARKGDVLHSLADISNAHKFLGYGEFINVKEGLTRTVEASLTA